MIRSIGSILLNKTPGKLRTAYQLLRLKQQFGDYAYRFDTYFRQTADIFFISFPKSGRTWLKYMLANYLEKEYGTKILAEDLFNFTKEQTSIPTLTFTHDGTTDKPINLNKKDLSEDKSFYFDSRKVVLLVRDPRDVVVSYFHHSTARKNMYSGTISEFIRSDYWGIEKIVTFLNNWTKYLDEKNLLLIRYEDVKSDEATSLKSIIEFLGLEYNEVSGNSAIEESKFDKMKSLISKGQIPSDILNPTNENPNSAKVRQGKVAGFKNELSQDDINYVNSAISKLNPVYGYKV